MPSPGDPSTPTTQPNAALIQSADAAVPDRIPLPPPAVAPAEPPQRMGSALDYILAVVVVGFAFLAASSPARNSDLWLHLATGREFVEGRYHVGADPFAQGTEGVNWVNCNWLYDVASYLVFRAAGGVDGLGGSALVLLKAIAAAALAAVLIRLGWCGRGLWAPAVGAAAAVLAISPWLALHPMIVSYLFLALTLYFLERPHNLSADDAKGANAITFRSYWPLLPLFVLWVNLDSWFLLGPLTVALYLLGQLVQSGFGPGRDEAGALRQGESKALALTLAAGLAVCLINPHHVLAFVTPPVQLGLSPAAQILQPDPGFRGLLTSPFRSDYFRAGGPGWNAAGMTYFVLVLLSGLSFLVNFAGWRWRRLLVWAALFLVSAFQMRAIPFFAVAAGPILALNAQEVLCRGASGWSTGVEARRWAALGRSLSLLAGLTLLVVGWPGWLHAPPWEPPRWAVDVDPGLRQAAEELARWRNAHILAPADVGFNLSADAANYFAWSCPEEKGVVDARHTLCSAAAAADLVSVRKELSAQEAWKTPEEANEQLVTWALAPENGADPVQFGGQAIAAVRQVLRRRGVNHLIVYDADRQLSNSWFQRLRQYPDEWPLLSLQGRCAVFAWRDPETRPAPGAFAKLALDMDRLAFQPPDDGKAPLAWPGREPTPPDWTDAFLRSRAVRSARTEEADLYLHRYDLDMPRHSFRTAASWPASLAAAVFGAAAGADGSLFAAYPMILPLHILTAGPSAPLANPREYKPTPLEEVCFLAGKDFSARQDKGSTALLYLALRAARRAINDNPDDANAYLVLGGVYKRLLQTSSERAWNAPQGHWDGYPPASAMLYRVRTTEAAAAYKHALLLNPDLATAHLDLISLYQELNYQDELLLHYQELLRCNRLAGLAPGETPKEFADRILDLDNEVRSRSKDVQDRLDRFEVKSAGLPVFKRANMALQEFGLADKALSLLLASDLANFGEEGMLLELDLLLHLGRVKEVRSWPDTAKAKELLGVMPFLEIQVQLEAASGDYRQADDDLAEMAAEVHSSEGLKGERSPTRAMVDLAVGQAVLLAQPEGGYQPYLFRISFYYPAILEKLQQMTTGIVREADFTTLRGMLALESGDIDAARDFFREALSVWGDDARAAGGGGLNFPARPIAQAGMETLRKVGP